MTSRALLAIAVLTLAGCSTTKPAIDGPIDYQVTGGIVGSGDGTPALHIELNGAMTRTAPGRAPESSMLDASTLASVRSKVEAADLASLDEVYTAGADDFVHVLSVSVDGALHRVMADRMADKPRELEVAIDALHDLATR